LALSTKRLVAATKFLVVATKILFVVPYFVAVTKPFFSVRDSGKYCDFGGNRQGHKKSHWMLY